MTAPQARIVVCGVGGAGVNTIVHLNDSAPPGVELLAIDTSHQSLAKVSATKTVHGILLRSGTRGLGTGGDAEAGRSAARRASELLSTAFEGADLVFVVAGLAGGTGGGAAPEVARIARARGAVVVGFGIRPFGFETARRGRAAEAAGVSLSAACDAWVRVDNQRALTVAGRDVGLEVALRVADDLVRQAVQGVGELVGARGTIDVDLAVVRRILTGAGRACVALGACCRHRHSEMPARDAMVAALASPLCDMAGLHRARGLLLQVSGGAELCVDDVAEAVRLLEGRLPPDCALVVGVSCREGLGQSAQVMLLGTGLCPGEDVSNDRFDVSRRPRPIAPALPVRPGALAPPPPLPAWLAPPTSKVG
jgi:cell division protein FtsZ